MTITILSTRRNGRLPLARVGCLLVGLMAVTGDTGSAKTPNAWKRVIVPFTVAESYGPGEAMVSIRFAFGQQTVEAVSTIPGNTLSMFPPAP